MRSCAAAPRSVARRVTRNYFMLSPTVKSTCHSQATISAGLRQNLGRVDGFDQDEPASETDDSFIADVGLLAPHSDAFEPLQLADRLFNARPQFVETRGKEAASLF